MALPVFYSSAYDRAGEQFDTLRKARWVADSLTDAPVAGVVLQEPEPLSVEQLGTIHARDYVEAVRTGAPRALAESNGFSWDAGLWEAVCASNGGAVAAALHALANRVHAGSLSSGLHHARRGRGAGFCTFNGLALAAYAALDAGAERVLVLDLDAHCGGGTHSLIEDCPAIVQLDVAVSAVDSYEPRAGTRSSLDIVNRATDYLPTLRTRLAALEDRAFDLVLYNAGMDPHEWSAIGGLDGIDVEVIAERERAVFDWARRRGVGAAFVLAGGYEGSRLDRETLVGLHRLTAATAAAAA